MEEKIERKKVKEDNEEVDPLSLGTREKRLKFFSKKEDTGAITITNSWK